MVCPGSLLGQKGNKMQGNFEAVWSRVTGQTPPKAVSEEERLLEYLKSSAAAADDYRLLLRKTGSAKAGMLLQRCLREELQLQRSLRSAYFLLTGDSCRMPEAERRSGRPFLQTLRDSCTAAELACADFARSADHASAALQPLYRRMSEQKARQASLLRSLSEQFF